MPSVYVSFDMKAVQDNVNRILDKKADTIHYVETRNEVAGIYAQYVDEYVPRLSGRLHSSVKVKDGELRYSAKARRPGGNFDYAATQYYTPVPPENRHTPGTYDHWNKHLSSAQRTAFYQEVAEIIAERINNDGQK